MVTTQDIRYRSCGIVSGWSEWVRMGETSGTLDAQNGVTCFQIASTGIDNLIIQCSLEGRGWMSPIVNEETCGDTDNKKRMNAIRIRLVNVPGYHVFYRVCMNDGSWSDWKRDFDIAGDPDGSLCVIAFEFQVVMDEPHLLYRGYVQNVGWTNFVGDNQVLGIEGKGQRLEALYIHYSGPGKLIMQANVENKGWLDEVSNDVVCGTERQGLRMESIRIRLLNVENYHVFYCVCIKGLGWQSWMKDGEDAGTEGSGQMIEAIRIRIAM